MRQSFFLPTVRPAGICRAGRAGGPYKPFCGAKCLAPRRIHFACANKIRRAPIWQAKWELPYRWRLRCCRDRRVILTNTRKGLPRCGSPFFCQWYDQPGPRRAGRAKGEFISPAQIKWVQRTSQPYSREIWIYNQPSSVGSPGNTRVSWKPSAPVQTTSPATGSSSQT